MAQPSRGLRPFAPTRFGRYTLLSPLGAGGMGEVYLARPNSSNSAELVVIKKLRPELSQENDFAQRLIDEARLVVMLNHGSIAQVFDVGVVGEEYFIAMEYVDGKDLGKLSKRLREQGELFPTALTLFAITRVLDAIGHAHRRRDDSGRELRLVHRDISPQNILISYRGEVKVIDFGLAKSALTLGRGPQDAVAGKFFYMAPEQARGEPVDRRSDLYSAGICLWELLAGRNPFDGVPAGDVLRSVANPRLPELAGLRPDLPSTICSAVSHALAPNPADRYASAEEMLADLNPAMRALDPLINSEKLGEFARRQFALEFESERRALSTLLRAAAVEPPASELEQFASDQEGESHPDSATVGRFDAGAWQQQVNGAPAAQPPAPASSAEPEPPAAPPPAALPDPFAPGAFNPTVEAVDQDPPTVLRSGRSRVPLVVASLALAATAAALFVIRPWEPAPSKLAPVETRAAQSDQTAAPKAPEAPETAAKPADKPVEAPADAPATPTPTANGNPDAAPVPLPVAQPAQETEKPRRPLSKEAAKKRDALVRLHNENKRLLERMTSLTSCERIGLLCQKRQGEIAAQFDHAIDDPADFAKLGESLRKYNKELQQRRKALNLPR